MKSRSIKAKGKTFERQVRKVIIDKFPELEDHIRVTVGSETGSDLKLDKEALKVLPFSIECKSRASIALYSWYDQCCNHKGGEPIVIFKANRRKPLVALDLEYFLTLIQKEK